MKMLRDSSRVQGDSFGKFWLSEKGAQPISIAKLNVSEHYHTYGHQLEKISIEASFLRLHRNLCFSLPLSIRLNSPFQVKIFKEVVHLY